MKVKNLFIIPWLDLLIPGSLYQLKGEQCATDYRVTEGHAWICMEE
jgi:hypothetical protein